MKIKKLFNQIPGATIRGSKEVEVTGITANSRAVAPGNLFIAKQGLNVSGTQFIADALAAGATAVLTDLCDPSLSHVTQIVHPDVASVEASLAKTFYGHASDRLFLVGITGTSGKTTTSYLVAHLLSQCKEPCGLIGGVEWVVGSNAFPSSMTTPDVLTNQRLLRDMAAAGCTACAMEVSSHGLEQGRVDLIEYDVAIFHNLTRDHLDYHGTMEAYAASKSKLFTALKSPQEAAKKQFAKVALINADSPFAEQMVAICKADVIRFGIDTPCDLHASHIELTRAGSAFDVEFRGKRHRFHSPLIGKFNIYNLLAATGAGLARGLSLPQIAAALATFSHVPGRLEKVPNDKGLHIFVDHAHKVDALSSVLSTLRSLVQGRIITVFGCGGNRDKGKRPLMGAIAESLSDVTLITSDNPRHENPEEIIREILAGFQDPRTACVIVNRAEAIERAIRMATPNDLVLIAGKGHETHQIFAHQTLPFDDRQAARAACQALEYTIK